MSPKDYKPGRPWIAAVMMQQLKRGNPAQGPAAEDVSEIEGMARAAKTAGGQEASGTLVPAQTKEAASALRGTPNDTVSNPYYDYSTDSLYVGASNGTLHKFNPAFGGTPAEVVGSGWPLTLNASYVPSSPVNALSTPAGTSQIYFQTLYTAGTSPCTGICAVQASQAAP
jgi:hypothetical protein